LLAIFQISKCLEFCQRVHCRVSLRQNLRLIDKSSGCDVLVLADVRTSL
jgi:hypothetical protein